MCQVVDSPALTVCVDIVAMEVAGENLEKYLKHFGSRIQWIHYSDSHHKIVGSGEYGREKLESYVHLLEQYDYTNCLDLEINDSIYWQDPHASIEKSVAYLSEFLPKK